MRRRSCGAPFLEPLLRGLEDVLVAFAPAEVLGHALDLPAPGLALQLVGVAAAHEEEAAARGVAQQVLTVHVGGTGCLVIGGEGDYVVGAEGVALAAAGEDVAGDPGPLLAAPGARLHPRPVAEVDVDRVGDRVLEEV